MTLNEARDWIAQEPSEAIRHAAEELLQQALALPQLRPDQRDAAITHLRQLEANVPPYRQRSFGASVLEAVGDTLADPAQKRVVYGEALYMAQWHASGASAGGEGTARAGHVLEIDQRLQALDPANSLPARPAAHAVAVVDEATESIPTTRKRSRFTTVLAWIFIVVGALGLPMSLLSLATILVGGYGSNSATFLGGLVVIGGPPATFVAGIGLLRRRWWAHRYALFAFGVIALQSLMENLRGSTPEVSTVSPGGVVQTQLAWSPNYALNYIVIAVCALFIAKLLSPAVRSECSAQAAIGQDR